MPRGMVRRAQLDDAQAIACVHVTASLETYANLLLAERLSAFTVERRAKEWQQIIEMPNSPDETGVFVAEDESNTVVGFGYCSRQRSEEMKNGSGFPARAFVIAPQIARGTAA